MRFRLMLRNTINLKNVLIPCTWPCGLAVRHQYSLYRQVHESLARFLAASAGAPTEG